MKPGKSQRSVAGIIIFLLLPFAAAACGSEPPPSTVQSQSQPPGAQTIQPDPVPAGPHPVAVDAHARCRVLVRPGRRARVALAAPPACLPSDSGAACDLPCPGDAARHPGHVDGGSERAAAGEGPDAQVAPAPRPAHPAQAARRLRRRPDAAPTGLRHALIHALDDRIIR